MPSGLIVTINARVATKEAMPVAKEVGAGKQIDDEKQRSSDSQCRNSSGIDYTENRFKSFHANTIRSARRVCERLCSLPEHARQAYT
jgi:hypothetical protein